MEPGLALARLNESSFVSQSLDDHSNFLLNLSNSKSLQKTTIVLSVDMMMPMVKETRIGPDKRMNESTPEGG